MAVHGFSQGDSRAFPATTYAGEEPVWVLVRFPECSKAKEEVWADGDFSGFTTFAVDDADDHAFAIDVFGADVDCFAESQSASVNDGEIGAVSAIAKGRDEEADFLASEHVGEWLVAVDFDLTPDCPTLAEVVTVVSAEGVDSLIERASSEFSISLKMSEKGENLFATEVRCVEFGVVSSELFNPPEVGFYGSLHQAF